MSRYKMKHSLLQDTPINDNMTSNEETKDTVNSALHQNLDCL